MAYMSRLILPSINSLLKSSSSESLSMYITSSSLYAGGGGVGMDVGKFAT